MDFWQSIAQLVLGGALTLISQLILRALRQRARTSGQRHSMLDLAHSSRLLWMQEASRLRRVCFDHGVPLEIVGPLPDDPWEEFALKQALSLTAE